MCKSSHIVAICKRQGEIDKQTKQEKRKLGDSSTIKINIKSKNKINIKIHIEMHQTKTHKIEITKTKPRISIIIDFQILRYGGV